MTNPHDNTKNQGCGCGCGHKHDQAAGSADRVITPDHTGGQVVDREPIAVTEQTTEGTVSTVATTTNPAAGTSDEHDLGLKDVHATGGGCTCGNPDSCSCGHHSSCDCPPGQCHCQGHQGGHGHGHGAQSECGCHGNEGGVPDHGDCECQQCHNARAEQAEKSAGGAGGQEKDFSNPDTVNADGTNPAVRTVNKAEGYNEGAGWNDGIAPRESANPQSYENTDDRVN